MIERDLANSCVFHQVRTRRREKKSTHRRGGGFNVVHNGIVQVHELFGIKDAFGNVQVGFRCKESIDNHIFNGLSY